MKKNIKKLITVAFLAGSSICSYGASKYGTDSVECVKNLSLYGEHFKQKNYRIATKSWVYVFDNCPQASENTFINGVKMYKSFLDKEKDATVKKGLLDTLEMIYNKRIEYFGKNKGYILGAMGSDIMKYDATNGYSRAFDMMKESVKIEGMKTKAGVTSAYFQAAVMKMQDNSLSKIDVLDIYSEVMDIVEGEIAKGESNKSYANYVASKENIERLMIDKVKPDCPTLIGLLEPRYNANPNDVDLLKKIIKTLDKDCDDSELYLNAVVNLEKIEPSADASHNIAKMYYKIKKDFSKSIEYYKKAISLETDGAKKAKYNYELALVYFATSSNSAALSHVNTALSLNPSMGDAYLLKAKLFVAGAGDCAKGDEQEAFKKKTVYWAAVDLCNTAKAKDSSVAGEANKLISNYSNYFPGNEEIFFQGLSEGASYNINCWFTATTTVRAKK